MKINLPKYPITHEIVSELATRIIHVFGINSIAGIYLGGSLAIGGFNEASSDLDFLVITKRQVTNIQFDALKNMHDELRAAAKNRLYTNYEGEYLTSLQAINPFKNGTQTLHLGSDGHLAYENNGPALIIDLWKIREAGFKVYGESPEKTIGSISLDNMLDSKKKIFKTWWLPMLQVQKAMDSEYQAYAVLTMCRILYGLEMNNEVSKAEAAEWLMGKRPEFAGLIQQSLDWRQGQVMDKLQDVYELMSFVNQKII